VTAFNVVRFRVKPGGEERFLAEMRGADMALKGLRRMVLVKTGERSYCEMGEWDRFSSIVAARPQMIAMLDRVRDTLEDLGGGLGVTDPVSGEAIVDRKVRRRKK
jgi:hypothetical protein